MLDRAVNFTPLPAVELRNLVVEGGGGEGADLRLRRGEILGLAGIVGAGRTELLRAMFGLALHYAGDYGEAFDYLTEAVSEDPDDVECRGALGVCHFHRLEFVSAEKGLGYLVLVANGELNTTLVFASVVTLSILGVVFYFLLELLERFVIRWHVSVRRPETGTL